MFSLVGPLSHQSNIRYIKVRAKWVHTSVANSPGGADEYTDDGGYNVNAPTNLEITFINTFDHFFIFFLDLRALRDLPPKSHAR